jgi:hypothetical protein
MGSRLVAIVWMMWALGCGDDAVAAGGGGGTGVGGGAGAPSEGGSPSVGGAGGDGGTLEPSAMLSGSVEGESFAPVSVISGVSPLYVFVMTALETDHTAVAISGFADECGNTVVEGLSLYIDIFQNPSLPDSTVTEPGTFAAWLPPLNGGDTPTDNRAVLTFIDNGPTGGSASVAQSGELTITSVSEAGISGTFDVTFENGELTGTFDAPACSPWTRSGSAP